jgi:hypothetical protein
MFLEIWAVGLTVGLLLLHLQGSQLSLNRYSEYRGFVAGGNPHTSRTAIDLDSSLTVVAGKAPHYWRPRSVSYPPPPPTKARLTHRNTEPFGRPTS